jgi:hypothetical protein
VQHSQKENIDLQKATRSQLEREGEEGQLERERWQHRSRKSMEKSSVMTECTRKSREKSTPGKISRSKIVSLVNHNESELEELLYSSITEMEREVQGFGEVDLARENKLLRCSIGKLKLILKQKLEVALKKNKEELTIMFDEYSAMIKKLLEDKETLTDQLQATRQKCATEQARAARLEEAHEEQVRAIVEDNHAQIATTKQQIEEFLDMIIQYEEEAAIDKAETEKLRERLVELEMENDRLRNDTGSMRDTARSPLSPTTSHNEEQLEKYALKIESLLTMLEELQRENEELNEFLKSCKCSRIQGESGKNSKETLESAEEARRRGERQLVEAEKEYIREEMMLREVLKKKDECIDRLNLVIEELRRARYGSVDKMTDDAFMSKLTQKNPK